MAAVADLEAEEHVREPGDERRPEAHEVPHRATLVERDDARLARGVIVLDRRVQLLALKRDVAADVLDVVRDLLGVVIRHVSSRSWGRLCGTSLESRPDGPQLLAEARACDEPADPRRR